MLPGDADTAGLEITRENHCFTASGFFPHGATLWL